MSAETVISIGAGAGVFVLYSCDQDSPLTGSEIGPAVLAAATFFIVNSALVSAILAVNGRDDPRGFFDALDVRVMIVSGGVVVAIAAVNHRGFGVGMFLLAVLPLLVLRQVLSGHFEAHHDRERLKGLFETTLAANRTMSAEAVSAAIVESARSLLRCPQAELVARLGCSLAQRSGLPAGSEAVAGGVGA